MLLFKIAFLSLCSSVCKTRTLPADALLQNSLVAYYAFTGNTMDSTRYHNDAIALRAQLTADKWGIPNRAYYFNGISSFMKIKKSPSLNLKKSFSISAWIKPDNFENAGVIVWHGDLSFAKDPYLLYLLNLPAGKSLSLRKDVGAGDTLNQVLASPRLTPPGYWTHVVGVCDADAKLMKIYTNGKLSASKIFARMDINYSTSNFYTMIGCAEGTYGNESFFRGALDEIRIYNRALSHTEIMALSLKK